MALDQEQTVDVQDDCWQTAQARSDVFRRLLTVSDARERSRFIAHAIKELSISRATFYRLLARFRTAEVTSAVLPEQAGRKRGSRFLDPPREAISAACSAGASRGNSRSERNSKTQDAITTQSA